MSERRLLPGDWEITCIEPFSCFHADQLDERRSFSVHRILASVDEVEAFIKSEQLTCIGTRTHGMWPVRQYRASRGAPPAKDH